MVTLYLNDDDDPGKHIFPCIENPLRVTLKCNGYYIYCVNNNAKNGGGKLATRKTRGNERDEFQIINTTRNSTTTTTSSNNSNNNDEKETDCDNDNADGSVRLLNYKFGTYLSVVMINDDKNNNKKKRNSSSRIRKSSSETIDDDVDGAIDLDDDDNMILEQRQQRKLQCVKIVEESEKKQSNHQKFNQEEENDNQEEEKKVSSKTSSSSSSADEETQNENNDHHLPSEPTSISNPQQADTENILGKEEEEAGREEIHSRLQEEKEKREKIFKMVMEEEEETGEENGDDAVGHSSSSTTDDDDDDDKLLNDNVKSDWIWIEASNGKVLIKNCQTADTLGIDDSGNLILVDSTNEDPENPQCLWNVETVTGELLFMSNVALISSQQSPQASLFPIEKNLQLRCDISGRLSLVENCKGWEVFRFMESSCGHGYVRISSWMHHQWILACNSNGVVQMQKIDSTDYNNTSIETVDVNNKTNNDNQNINYNDCWCVHWAVEKAPNGKGVVIRSKKHGRFLNVDTSNNNTNILSTYHPFDESTREFVVTKDNNRNDATTSTTTKKNDDVAVVVVVGGDDNDDDDDEITRNHQDQTTTTSNQKDDDVIYHHPFERKIIPSKDDMKNADFIQEKQANGETVITQDYFLHSAMANKTAATAPSPSSASTSTRRRWFRRGGSQAAPSSPDIPPTESSPSSSRVVAENPDTTTIDNTAAIRSTSQVYRIPPKETIVWNLHPAHLQQYNFYNAPSSTTTDSTKASCADTNEKCKERQRKDDHNEGIATANQPQFSIGPFPQVSTNLRRTDKFQLIRTAAITALNTATNEDENSNDNVDEVIVTRLYHLDTNKLVACSSDGKIYLKEEEEECHETDNDNDDHDEDDHNDKYTDGFHSSVHGHLLDETEWIMERASCGSGGNIFQSRAYPEYYLSHGSATSVYRTSSRRMTSSSFSTDASSEQVGLKDDLEMQMGNSDNGELSDRVADVSIDESVEKTAVNNSTSSREGKSAEQLIDASNEETANNRNTVDTPSSGPVRNFFRRRRQQQAESDGKKAANDENSVKMDEGKEESATAEKSDSDVPGDDTETGEMVDKEVDTTSPSTGPVRNFFRRRREQQQTLKEEPVDVGNNDDEAAAAAQSNDTVKNADDSGAGAPAPASFDGSEEAETEETIAKKVEPTSSSGPERNFLRRRRQHAVNEEPVVDIDEGAKGSTAAESADETLDASNVEEDAEEVADKKTTPSSGPVRNFLRRRRQQRQEQKRSSSSDADADTSENVEHNIVPGGKTELVASKTIGEREKWVLHPVMPRAINSGKIKTFAIGTSLVVGSSLAMPFAMAGAGALLGAAGAHIGVVGHVVMAGLSSFDALSSVGTVGATAYLVFRSQENALTDDHQADKDKEEERAWSKRPFSNWRNW